MSFSCYDLSLFWHSSSPSPQDIKNLTHLYILRARNEVYIGDRDGPKDAGINHAGSASESFCPLIWQKDGEWELGQPLRCTIGSYRMLYSIWGKAIIGTAPGAQPFKRIKRLIPISSLINLAVVVRWFRTCLRCMIFLTQSSISKKFQLERNHFWRYGKLFLLWWFSNSEHCDVRPCSRTWLQSLPDTVSASLMAAFLRCLIPVNSHIPLVRNCRIILLTLIHAQRRCFSSYVLRFSSSFIAVMRQLTAT